MKKCLSLLAAGAALFAVSDAAAFTFDDIHFWVGSGTNRVGVVIDWSTKHGEGAARAWGYRWNGTCTNLAEVVDRIVRADSRLHIGASNTAFGMYYTFFGYDVADVAATFDTTYPGFASDPAAFSASEYDGTWTPDSPLWNLLEQHGSETYMKDTNHVATAGTGTDGITPLEGDWFTFRIDSWGGWSESGVAEPTAAESPYGYSVVSYQTDETSGWYNDPSVALGEPIRYMAGEWGGTVNPFNPAWGGGSLFTIAQNSGADAHLTLAFDHDVVDDANNPFGIDFIVFGNSFCVGQSGAYYSDGADIDTLYSSAEGSAEPGLVEVSQDGTKWYSFNNGPFADDAMPTLGYIYDKENPDATLFAGNAWFGLPTDATFPVNPAMTFAWCAGRTLGEICRAYNGSAGGTGFDLSKLDLPVNAAGQKWIRYVRVKPIQTGVDADGYPEYTTPEVDAVADVSPIIGFVPDPLPDLVPVPDPGPTPEPAPVHSAWTATKAATLAGAVYAGGSVAGVIQLKVAKPNTKKQTVKLSGNVTLLDGKKKTLKSTTVSLPKDAPIRANVSVKGLGTLAIEIGSDGFAGTLGSYTVSQKKVGGKWTGTASSVQVDFAGGSGLPQGTIDSLLPAGEPVRVKAGKWTFDKAASVKVKNGATLVDTSKKRTNLSALKLTYTPTSGLFKGSFKLYAILNGKLKKYTVKVTGVVIDGEGAGVAKLAKPSSTWNVSVK